MSKLPKSYHWTRTRRAWPCWKRKPQQRPYWTQGNPTPPGVATEQYNLWNRTGTPTFTVGPRCSRCQQKKSITRPHTDKNKLIPNSAPIMDPTTVQLPGVHASAKEQALENNGLQEYSFEVQLRRQSNATDMTIFQNIVNKITQIDPMPNSFYGIWTTGIYQI